MTLPSASLHHVEECNRYRHQGERRFARQDEQEQSRHADGKSPGYFRNVDLIFGNAQKSHIAVSSVQKSRHLHA